MNAPAKRKAHVIRSFTDAGTGESFTTDDTPLITTGAFANYEAAGLVRAPDPERKPRAAAKPKGTTRRAPPPPPPPAPVADGLTE
jgi:hypothetical protein